MSSHPAGAVTGSGDQPPPAPSEGAFANRAEAGRELAALLARFGEQRPVVVGVPRGGVPVAAEVASALGAPLDVALVRKIGAPGNPEYAVGAVAEGGVRLLDDEVARAVGLSDCDLQALIARAEQELASQSARYRGAGEPLDVRGRTAILVDDGLATGRSAHAAIRSLRRRGAGRVILAVPVAAPESARALRGEADEIVCVQMPPDMWAVGVWYRDFSQTDDEQVAALLGAARRGGVG